MRTLLFLIAAATTFAQTTGSIAGRIVDDFGEPISGASIIARGPSGQEFKATSSASGEYILEKLPNGIYDVNVSAVAMKPFAKRSLVVEPTKTLRLDAPLADVAFGTLGDGDRFSSAFNAARRKAPPEGATPRTPDGKPDFSGYWTARNGLPGQQPQPRPWAEAIRQERRASEQRDDPFARCLPRGVISNFARGKLVHTSKLLLMLFEDGDPPRQVYLDGRSHPKDLIPPGLDIPSDAGKETPWS